MWLFAYCTTRAYLTDHPLLSSSSIWLIHSLHDVLLIQPVSSLETDRQARSPSDTDRGRVRRTERWISLEADKNSTITNVQARVFFKAVCNVVCPVSHVLLRSVFACLHYPSMQTPSGHPLLLFIFLYLKLVISTPLPPGCPCLYLRACLQKLALASVLLGGIINIIQKAVCPFSGWSPVFF